VLECRLVFEPGLAPLVVARASHAGLDRIDECLRGADAARDVAGFEAADAAFHDAIAVATHNQTVIAVSRTGILQADAYAGFNDLYHPGRKPGPLTEAGCWAHTIRTQSRFSRWRCPWSQHGVSQWDDMLDLDVVVVDDGALD